MEEASYAPLPFDEIDDANAALILQIQQENLSALHGSHKSHEKRLKSEPVDSDVAIDIYDEELFCMKNKLADRILSHSIAQACRPDSTLLSQVAAQEEAEVNDREFAQLLGESADAIPPTANVVIDHDSRNPSLVPNASGESDIRSLVVTEGESSPMNSTKTKQYASNQSPGSDIKVEPGLETDQKSEEHSAPEKQDAQQSDPSIQPISKQRKRKISECVACGEEASDSDLLQAPCAHEYCTNCIETIFQLSTTNETNFPPKCCNTEIPLSSARLHLYAELVARFENISEEFSTADKTYCSRPTCSTFIPRGNIDHNKGTCPICASQTCVICKRADHDNDCSSDEEFELTLAIARKEEWQRCPSCRQLIELTKGCHHMTCTCKASFCYLCAAKWRTCSCVAFTEGRLLERADAIVDHQANHHAPGELPPPPLTVNERRVRVEREMRRIRQRDSCPGHTWSKTLGWYTCEQCWDDLDIYIFICSGCQMRICKHCRGDIRHGWQNTGITTDRLERRVRQKLVPRILRNSS